MIRMSHATPPASGKMQSCLTAVPVNIARNSHRSQPAGRAAYLIALGLFLFLGSAIFPCEAQTTSRSQLQDYSNAVAHPQAADRIRELERFAWTASGPLRTDALEFVVWEYLRAGNHVHAFTWSNELQAADKDNALALAVICDNAQRSAAQRMPADRLLTTATHGLDALPRLRRPMGMNETDFARMRQQALIMLKRATGHAELQRKDYLSAGNDLRQVVAVDPRDAQSVYLLALADLNGKNPDAKQGYWELARAVELSRGTPQGREIAQYARGRYVDDGGSNTGWDQFLRAAAASKPSLAPSGRFGSASAMAAKTTPSAPKTALVKPPTVAKASKPPTRPERPHADDKQAIWADKTVVNPPLVRRHRVSSGPMSLGILIETSLATKESRSAVVNSLIDMLRHMNDEDEAFILSYDNNLVFQQDLTNDPQQLETAMEDIKPKKGAVLDDAVAFAAGHLARIAKNPNRVLLVISDGRNVDSRSTPVQTSSRINTAGVRIYCIGMDVDQQDGRYHLQALSSSTGGRSDFISGPSQFRTATRQIAQNIGIDFRF